MESTLLRRDARKPDPATFAFLVGWLFYLASGVEGILHVQGDSYLISASESGWVYLWYNVALAVAALGGIVATFNGMRQGEAHALFVISGLLVLHGSTLLIYASGEGDDWRGFRMLGSAMILLAFGISLLRVSKLHREVVKHIGENP